MMLVTGGPDTKKITVIKYIADAHYNDETLWMGTSVTSDFSIDGKKCRSILCLTVNRPFKQIY